MNGRDLLAWNMKRLRVMLGMSQERLANDAGVDRTYVSRLERRLENPTLSILDKLAETLGIHVSELLRQPNEDEAAPTSLRAGRKPEK